MYLRLFFWYVKELQTFQNELICSIVCLGGSKLQLLLINSYRFTGFKKKIKIVQFVNMTFHFYVLIALLSLRSHAINYGSASATCMYLVVNENTWSCRGKKDSLKTLGTLYSGVTL